jgi:cysteine desulfurase/selenocysteine lyase
MQLDLQGICIRTGHHCCQPLMDRLGIASTARASFAIYNELGEIDRLADALTEIVSRARRPTGPAGRHPASAERAAKPEPLAVTYAPAAASSPASAAEAIAEIFELLPDWPMRHQQIMDLGEHLPSMPESLKTPATLVPGCQSRVYLVARVRPDSDGVIDLIADSDASIVRGLIAILLQLYSGQSASAILAFDVTAFLRRLGLDEHLSLTRRNGLAAMVERVRRIAAAQLG